MGGGRYKYDHHSTEQLPRMDAHVAEPFLPAQAGHYQPFQQLLKSNLFSSCVFLRTKKNELFHSALKDREGFSGIGVSIGTDTFVRKFVATTCLIF
jgi:hypothetical protein